MVVEKNRPGRLTQPDPISEQPTMQPSKASNIMQHNNAVESRDIVTNECLYWRIIWELASSAGDKPDIVNERLLTITHIPNLAAKTKKVATYRRLGQFDEA